jgi:HEAT repeat protein
MNRKKYRYSLLLIIALAATASRAHSEENAGPSNLRDLETRIQAMSILLDTKRPSPERVEASRTLSTAPSTDFLPRLEPLLSDRDAAVRQAVVYTYALCALTDSKRFPSPLLPSLDDKAPQVREAVAEVVSLSETFTPADRAAFIQRLSDDAWQVRSKLAGTMYLVDDITRKSLPSLKKLLTLTFSMCMI